jgi:competence protein ComEC
MEKKAKRLAFLLLGSVCSLGVIAVAESPANDFRAEATDTHSCADITFGTAEYSSSGGLSIGSFKTALAVSNVSVSSCYCPSTNASSSSNYSARIGKSGTGGSLTFTFAAARITKIKVLAYKFGSDSAKTATCTVSTSAQTNAQSKEVTSTTAPNITDSSTDPGLVFSNLDNGGTSSTSLTIASDSVARFNLCKIVLTLGGSSVASSSAVTSSAVASSSAGATAAPLDIYLQELGNQHSGDSIYIKAGNNDILIDAGSTNSSGATLTSFLKGKMADNQLEYVIATHAHTDHIGAFYGTNGIFSNFDCRTIIDFPKYGSDKDPTSTTSVFGQYVHARDAEVSGGSSFGAEHYTALECYNANTLGTTGAHRRYSLGNNLEMDILYNYFYDHSQSGGENDYSVCLQFIQGNNHYLFCGDCEDLSEKTVVANNSLSHCVFYKADHHGSKTSTSPELMAAITPSYVGVSCVAGNYEYSQTHFDYTFPCQRTINTLGPITKAIMVTSLGSATDSSAYSSFNGTIHVASSGTNEGDVTMTGSANSTYLKDSAWFKETGHQEGGAVDEGVSSVGGSSLSVTHATTDANRYWPEGGVD